MALALADGRGAPAPRGGPPPARAYIDRFGKWGPQRPGEPSGAAGRGGFDPGYGHDHWVKGFDPEIRDPALPPAGAWGAPPVDQAIGTPHRDGAKRFPHRDLNPGLSGESRLS